MLFNVKFDVKPTLRLNRPKKQPKGGNRLMYYIGGNTQQTLIFNPGINIFFSLYDHMKNNSDQV